MNRDTSAVFGFCDDAAASLSSPGGSGALREATGTGNRTGRSARMNLMRFPFLSTQVRHIRGKWDSSGRCRLRDRWRTKPSNKAINPPR